MKRTPLLLILALSGAATAQSTVRFTPSFEEAVQRAKTEGKVLMLAFNMEGERANDEMVDEHYKDATIAKLANQMVNVFCSVAKTTRVPGVSVAEQQAAEKLARTSILKIGPDQDVAAPQHVFVGPDGTVLSSVVYRVTKGELEWAMVDAIRKVDPTFKWDLSARARAPEELSFGSARSGDNSAIPTKEQVDEALKEIKKMRGGFGRMRELAMVVLRSDDPEAIKFAKNTLQSMPDQAKTQILRTIGVLSPKPYHEAVTPYLDHRIENIRYEAAAAIDQLAEPKALPAVQKQWRAEKVDRVRGRLLRAMARTGPANRTVIQTVSKALESEKTEDMRAHAVLATALLEDRNAVHEALGRALTDADPKVRSTAAYALAIRRDVEMVGKLEQTASVEPDADCKVWMQEAIKVVRGAPADFFKNFMERVLGETAPRAGLNFGGEGGGRGG